MSDSNYDNDNAIMMMVIQWNPGLTICQGIVKIISLNRDIVIAEFLV